MIFGECVDRYRANLFQSHATLLEEFQRRAYNRMSS
jgi:hypothetical protein